jgi:hypothetical protein
VSPTPEPSGPSSPGDSAAPPVDLAELRRRQARRWPRALAAFIVGLLLLGIAIRVVLRERVTLDAGLAALRAAPAWMLIAALALPLVNLLCAAASFWVLTNRHGRVRYAEMLGLIGSAWLLNHLPLRPGMIGRVAYHKLVHGISIRASLAVLLSALICAGIGMATLLLITVVLHALHAGIAVWIITLAAPIVLGLLAAHLTRRRELAAASPTQHWRYPAAIVFRYLDVCCWTARYALVFALLGRPITPDAAAALSLSSQAAMLSPIQLGLREWMVGLAASIVARSSPHAADHAPATLELPESLGALAPGLLADMVNRAAELSVAIPVGLIATAVLYARFRRIRQSGGVPPRSAAAGNGNNRPAAG